MASRFSWPHAVFGGLLGLAAWQGQRLSVSDALWRVEAQPAHLSLAGEAEKAKVLIINTGGTFGMKPLQPSAGQRGMQLAPAPGFLENFLQGMQELQDPAMPQYEVRELEPLIDSSAMGPSDWTKIARTLERNYMKYHGFVVITGTDTMAYAGSALSFMLEDLAKPVVFTGSMIPLAEPYNDARRNLILSMQFAAAQQSFPEVMIFFNDRLLRANRATKYSADGLDAFGSPNFPPLAIVGTSVRARTDLVVSNPRGYMKVHPVADAHVLVIRLVPGFDAGVLSMIVEGKQSLRALVLETYGTGNAPVLAAVAEARKRDLLVVVCSQCPQGCVEMNQYAAGAELAKQGVISAGDMTTEATVTKLTFLLSRYSTDQVAHRMGDDLRGEITPMDSAAAPWKRTSLVRLTADRSQDLRLGLLRLLR